MKMGHFRVAVCLGFEVSLGAQLLLREMSLICIRIRNSFPFEWLCSRTRFETEACSNSEMGYCSTACNVCKVTWPLRGPGFHE